ncbi:uncharacterized protein VNE69_07084 [Vairimorpha necatrix]|uniref:Uncharacterized protein n=1 Tax=Vairimorpha necatrix TaxID=6039 RepID=A0AAX4JDH3_9MICR
MKFRKENTYRGHKLNYKRVYENFRNLSVIEIATLLMTYTSKEKQQESITANRKELKPKKLEICVSS